MPMAHINAWISFHIQFLGTGIRFRQLTVPELSKIFVLSPIQQIFMVLSLFLLYQSRALKLYFYPYWTLNIRIVQPFRIAINTFLSNTIPCLKKSVINIYPRYIHIHEPWMVWQRSLRSCGKQVWWDVSGHTYVGCKDHGSFSIIYNFSSVKVSKICVNSKHSNFVQRIHYFYVK